MKIYKYSEKASTDELIIKSIKAYEKEKKLSFKEIRIKRNLNGKPFTDNENLFVGVTHANEITFVGVWDKNFGIDAEPKTRKLKKADSIIEKFFSEKEREYVLSAENEERNLRFLEIWVEKEAYLKYLGTGIKDLEKADVFSVKGDFKRVCDKDYIIYIYTE